MDVADGGGDGLRVPDVHDEPDERYTALAESVEDLVFITDLTSRMRYANGALLRQAGFTVEDFQFPQADNPFIHRDDAARVSELIGAFIASGETRSPPLENRFLDRWGRTHRSRAVVTKVTYRGEPALQFVCRALSPLAPGGEGPPGGGEYRALIEAADEAILRLDGAGRILFANPQTEALTGLAKVELGKRTLAELLDGSGRETLVARLASDAGRGGGERCEPRIEARLVALGGEVHDVEVGVGSLARFGVPGEWLALVRDVTAERAAAAERARLEQQLRDAQKLETVGGLAAGIAHDFNNLLAAVMTNVGLARADLARGNDAGPRLDEIQRASSRAASLCRQLLAYTGRAPVRVGPVDLHVLVDDLAHLMGAALLGRGVLRRIRSGAPAMINADAAQLQQLVMTLIVNASDALGEASTGGGSGSGSGSGGRSGEVTVETGTCRRDGAPVVYLRVTDTGCGMDETTRARMFDPYFTTKRFGRGLGLAGVLGIARAHHGAIDVTSAPGRGTTVEVALPAGGFAAMTVPPPPVAPPGPEPAAWRGAGTVIVADDEPAVRTAVALVLASAGFAIVEADDGAAAIDALAAHAGAAAIVLDVTMPNLGGVEALRRLRAAGATIPAVLISGYQEQAISATTTAALGPVEFLGKPFEVDELIAALRHALAQSASG